MLTSEDLKAIGKIVEDSAEDARETVNKGFQHLEDKVNSLQSDMTGVKEDIKTMKADIKDLQTTVATLPDKDFVDRRFAKTDGKIVTLTNVLMTKGVITEDDKRLVHAA